jgi:hypothetical protein
MVFFKVLKAIFGKQGNNNNVINEKEKFVIDFLRMNQEVTLKKAEIFFPDNSKDIMINGLPQYFDPYYITEAGKSSDGLYFRIYTADFAFWIKPKDYVNLKTIMMKRREQLLTEREQRNEQIKKEYMAPFEYDKIDEGIYKCFIAYKSGMCDAIGNWTTFRKIEDKLDTICKQKNGRYYKTQAKSAKFAILFSYTNRTARHVESLRDKGYKVTSFENVIEYFGLQVIWDTKAIKNQVNKHKEFMLNMYK